MAREHAQGSTSAGQFPPLGVGYFLTLERSFSQLKSVAGEAGMGLSSGPSTRGGVVLGDCQR